MKQRQKNNPDVSGGPSISSVKKNLTKSHISVLPVFPSASKASLNRRHTSPLKRSDRMLHNSEDIIMTPCNAIIIQTTVDGKIQVSRTQKERDRNPDRLSLDKRDLNVFPILVGESRLRLLSLQHNLLAKLERMALQCLPQLVFLDIYNNQLENMSAFDCLHHLRVLLLGKNRIKTIEGLTNMTRLEVLDLHGNRITEVQNLKNQKELKVLNLAGNEIKSIGVRDLEGLHSLQEMNLRRNQIKTLQGFHETPQLLKLFLSNNEITSIEDLEGVTKLQQLKELSLDGNAVMSREDCIFYIISHMPSVQIFGQTRITEDIRKVAKVWRLRREFHEKPSASLDNERLKPLVNDDVKRTRSASENRISYLRKRSAGFRFFKADQKSTAPTKFLHRSQSSGQSTRMLEKNANARRLNYSRGKTVSIDSCAGSETSVEYFRLPPILTFSSNLVDDCNVTVRNDPNTSVESNKSCCSYRKDSTSSAEKAGSSSSSDCESETSAEEAEGDDAAPVISKNISPFSLDKEKNLAERLNEGAADTKTPLISEPKIVKVQRGNTRFEKVKEQGGDYLVQISGRFLMVTGKNSAKHVDKAWSQEKACDVTTIKFSCVLFNSLVPVFSRIKLRFPNVEHLVFNECELNCLGQLNALADIQGLTSLEILPDRNAIVKKNWRCYAIYRLHHWGLRTINNEQITEDEIKAAKEEFRGLSEMVLWSLPKSLLTPLLNKLRLEVNSNISAKQWLFKADPALRNVICKEALQWRSPTSLSQNEMESRERGKQTLSTTVEAGCNMVLKLRRLEKQWEPIMQEVVLQALKDLSNKEAYTEREINNLKPP